MVPDHPASRNTYFRNNVMDYGAPLSWPAREAILPADAGPNDNALA
jgi:hypothetical protein